MAKEIGSWAELLDGPGYHLALIGILRWLAEDPSRELPSADNDADIIKLAAFFGKRAGYVRTICALAYGNRANEPIR